MEADFVFCEVGVVRLSTEASSRHIHWLLHCLRWLIAGLSPRTPGFYPGPMHVRHGEQSGTGWQVSLRVLWFHRHSTVCIYVLLLPEEQTSEMRESSRKAAFLQKMGGGGGDAGQTYCDHVSLRWGRCVQRQSNAVCLLAALHLSGSCDVTSPLSSNGAHSTGLFVGSKYLQRYRLGKGAWMTVRVTCSLVGVWVFGGA
jgi:hypothetical protein